MGKKRKLKSVEQRLYEAFRDNQGLRLTPQEVQILVGPDDAIRTRLSNAAATERGATEPGGSVFTVPDVCGPSWESLGADGEE